MSGLDQQSGYPFDDKPYFGELLLKAVAGGELKEDRLTEMARRIVRTLFAKGVIDYPVQDLAHRPGGARRRDARRCRAGRGAAEERAAILPLSKRIARIAVIGGYADKGVLAGGGSSLVYPVGGNAVPGLEPTGWPGPDHVLPVVAAARHPGAGARCQGAVRQRRESRSGCRAGRQAATWRWYSSRSGPVNPWTSR